MTETPELMARVLLDSGMTVFSFDAEKAIEILKNTRPDIPGREKFNSLSFDVFLEMMRIEIQNK
jgi:hypothetical protein